MNVTIDDADLTQVTYYPPNSDPRSSWHDQGCEQGVCFIHPSKLVAFNGTWHDVTYRVGVSPEVAIQFSFKGRFPAQTICGVLADEASLQVLLSTYSSFS